MGMRWEALLERLPTDRFVVGVEVGVWQGRMSCALLRALPNLTLYMVDTWSPAAKGSEYRASGDKCANATPRDMVQALTTAIAGTQFAAERRRVWCMDSHTASLWFALAGSEPDFVFIDANHTRAAVMHDVEAWGGVVADGGLLCGHDYHSPRWGSEVDPAVDGYAAKYGYTVEAGEDHTWFIRKRVKRWRKRS